MRRKLVCRHKWRLYGINLTKWEPGRVFRCLKCNTKTTRRHNF